MKRTAAIFGLVLLPAVAAAQAIEGSIRGGAGTSCSAQAPGAQPFVQSDADPAAFTPSGSLSGTGEANSQCEREGAQEGVSAKSDATVSYSAAVNTAGTDVFGHVLVSTINISVNGTAKAEAHGNVEGVGSSARSGAEVVASFRVVPGTFVTVVVNPSGNFDSKTLRGSGFLPNDLTNGFAGPATDQFGGVEIAFSSGAGANTSPPSPANFTGSITATITFGSKPPQGACCTGPGACSDETVQAECSGTFLGDQVLCSAGGCGGSGPTPTPTATPPSTVFTWTNGSGGDYDIATNWSPPEVPGSVAGRDDTAIFDLTGTYAVSLAADRDIERLVVSHGRVELDNAPGVALNIAATSPSEPSVTIENDGRLDLISGIIRSVHTTIGHAPPPNPASPLIAEMLVSDFGSGWNTTGNLAVGAAGKGRLFIANGAQVISGSGTIGGFFGGEVSVGGRLTFWGSGNLAVGFGEGLARLNIEAGATVDTGVADVGRTSNALAETTVTGIDVTNGSSSSWNTDFLTVGGAQGIGKLTVLDGAFVLTTTLTVAEGAGSTGVVTVSGQNQSGLVPESRIVAESLTLGAGGDAFMRVEDGGAVLVLSPGNMEIGNGGGGDLTITGVDSLVSVGHDLLCTDLCTITNDGRLEVGGNAFIDVAATVSGTGQLSMTNGGTVTLVGTLTVPAGSPAPPLRRGALGPGPSRPFQITGDYVQGATGRLQIDVTGSAPGLFGTLAITGDATFGGTLEVAFVDGFLPAAGDRFAFLTVDGVQAGSFDRVRIHGVDEDLAFSTSLANGIHTFVVDADAHACTAADCEVCDNCLDDNGDGLVDRADPDCAAAADGAGAGIGGDAAARKALGKCAAAMAAVGAKLTSLVAKRLQSCTAAVLACVETKPGDATCLTKAQATCAKATTPIAPAGKDRSKARQTMTKACGARISGTPPAVPLATIVAATGLGFDAEVARCAALATPLASVDDVVACIDRATVCRASALFATRVPRASELLRRGTVAAPLLACLPSGVALDGAFGDPKTVGKPLLKCQNAIAAAGAKLAARLGKSYGACAAAMRGCVQSAAPADCLTKASSTCAKATRGLVTVGGATDAKLLDAVTKACGNVAPGALQAANGLGFAAVAERCAALGVPALDGPAALATCISREQACAVPTLVEAATPRLREHLGRAGVVLE